MMMEYKEVARRREREGGREVGGFGDHEKRMIVRFNFKVEDLARLRRLESRTTTS